jgi:prevent-host-death family protein
MGAMRETNVSGLKARLSEYLSAVRRGETVVVRDRHTPIARLIPFEEQDDLQVIEPKKAPRALAKLEPLRLRRRVDVVKLLRESRDQR